MTDPADVDLNDLVTRDELQSTIEGAVSDALNGGHAYADEFDPSDYVDPEAARDVADTTFIQRMRHLAYDDCETEECNRLREEFGLNPGEDDPVDDAKTGASEFDHNTDSGRGESPESDDIERNAFGEPVW